MGIGFLRIWAFVEAEELGEDNTFSDTHPSTKAREDEAAFSQCVLGIPGSESRT